MCWEHLASDNLLISSPTDELVSYAFIRSVHQSESSARPSQAPHAACATNLGLGRGGPCVDALRFVAMLQRSLLRFKDLPATLRQPPVWSHGALEERLPPWARELSSRPPRWQNGSLQSVWSSGLGYVVPDECSLRNAIRPRFSGTRR